MGGSMNRGGTSATVHGGVADGAVAIALACGLSTVAAVR
jgi:hypothetical protein